MKDKSEKDDDVDEAAVRWRARIMSGSVSDEDLRAYERWRRDPRAASSDAKLAQAIEIVDETADTLLAASFEEELRLAADALDASTADGDAHRAIGPQAEIGRPRRDRHLASPSPDLRKGSRRSWRAASLAASVALAVGVSGVIWSVNNGEAVEAPYLSAFAAPSGEIRTAQLPDGSAVDLNGGASIEVTYTDNKRLAKLTAGEAIFDVASDLERPFVVETPFGMVEVAGTAFSVDLGGADAQVFVLSGRVSVSAAGDAMALSPGDAAALRADAGVAALEQFDATRRLAWRDRMARFRDTPLREVAGELNEYFDTQIVLGDEALGDLPVTGDFALSDEAAAVAALSMAFDLTAQNGEDRVTLVRADP